MKRRDPRLGYSLPMGDVSWGGNIRKDRLCLRLALKPLARAACSELGYDGSLQPGDVVGHALAHSLEQSLRHTTAWIAQYVVPQSQKRLVLQLQDLYSRSQRMVLRQPPSPHLTCIVLFRSNEMGDENMSFAKGLAFRRCPSVNHYTMSNS